MERRSFLKGLFGGIAGGGAVILASDQEIALFGKNDIGTPVAASMLQAEPAFKPLPAEMGHFLYNAYGMPVGVLWSLEASPRSYVNVTTRDDDFERWEPTGIREATGTFRILGQEQFEGLKAMFYNAPQKGR